MCFLLHDVQVAMKAKITITYNLELSIAKQNKKQKTHNEKWKELLPVL